MREPLAARTRIGPATVSPTAAVCARKLRRVDTTGLLPTSEVRRVGLRNSGTAEDGAQKNQKALGETNPRSELSRAATTAISAEIRSEAVVYPEPGYPLLSVHGTSHGSFS